MNQQFITAGHAIFTLEMPPSFTEKRDLPPHYAFRIVRKEAVPCCTVRTPWRMAASGMPPG